MAKILAFAGSNSSTSINYQLLLYTAQSITDHQVHPLNMAHFPFPMYSMDLEKKSGYSNSMVELKNDIQNSAALLLAVNEHNGNPSAFFKNILDWLSRIDRKFMDGKKVFLMGTSPGKRGAKGALEVVGEILPRFGAEITTTFSLPSFGENFNSDSGITNPGLRAEHAKALEQFLESL